MTTTTKRPAKPRSPETVAANRAWNHRDGAKPKSPKTKTVPLTDQCPTLACGLPADDLDTATDPTLWGWIRTEVVGSREPARLWDSPQCAARGIALAQLRMEAEQ